MERLNENENFLFNEDTKFLELMIESELEETESYSVIKTYLLESLVDAYKYAQYEGFDKYELLDKRVVQPGQKKKLKIGFELVDSELLDELDKLSFDEFTEKLAFQLQLFINDDGNFDSETKDYPLTAEGLLQAVKGFYEEAKLNKMI